VNPDLLLAARPRWNGQPGRVEVWYATLTDPNTGTGVWLHAELVAPLDATRPPYRHGWIAVFPPKGEPTYMRFGPQDGGPSDGATWFESDACTVSLGDIVGRTHGASWTLRWIEVSPPLFTFPRVAWRRNLLPAAQVVVAPSATFDGEVEINGQKLLLTSAPGALAHIYGHGNAERWSWLHADLGGGDVCELVAAVSRRPGLRRLPPLAFAQLRVGGELWPRSPAAPLLSHTELGLPRWRSQVRARDRRLTVDVTLLPERCVALRYEDPDGATATCTNSERADAVIVLEQKVGGRWRQEQRWELDGTAHAEVGARP
jgi:hypothetical protein